MSTYVLERYHVIETRRKATFTIFIEKLKTRFIPNEPDLCRNLIPLLHEIREILDLNSIGTDYHRFRKMLEKKEFIAAGLSECVPSIATNFMNYFSFCFFLKCLPLILINVFVKTGYRMIIFNYKAQIEKVEEALPAKYHHGNHSCMSQCPPRIWTQPMPHGKETYGHLQIFPSY